MPGKQKRLGPRKPMFQDVANGVVKVTLPQVWVKPWVKERVYVAVDKQQAKLGGRMRYSVAAFIREAVEEKLERELGPTIPLPSRP